MTGFTEVELSPQCDAQRTPTTDAVAVDVADTDCLLQPVQAEVVAPTLTRQQPRAQIAFLDGLRGLAALLVVCHHAHIMDETFVNIGETAVDIFFVLSSFLLTMLLDRKVQQLLSHRASARQWLGTLVDYFVKRLLRVYPLFTVVALILWALPDDDRNRFYSAPPDYDIVKVLTFEPESRYWVFWSLPLEIAYYFVIPVFVVVMCLLGRWSQAWWWLTVASLYVWVIKEGVEVDRRAFQPLRPHLPTFVTGSLAAVVLARIEGRVNELKQQANESSKFSTKWRRATYAVRVIHLGAFALALSLAFHGLLFHWIAYNPVPQIYGATPFTSVPVSVVIVLEILFPSVLSPLLEWCLLRFMGKISFSIYLTHLFVVNSKWVAEEQETWFDQFFAWFFGVLALATASYWGIEYPSQMLAGRLSKRLRQCEHPSPPEASGSVAPSASVVSRVGATWCKWRPVQRDEEPSPDVDLCGSDTPKVGGPGLIDKAELGCGRKAALA
jgi:peptidoglycan/LPS O-acetylase OafA/YrhL